ncbi:pectinesterase inhibitor 1-like [Abrus precatorius]|uniref:Pectinesterase inhibitor 1-like n=1 Tax=Abrus precatorius TaxID=3816 RepID=A0A8B8LMN3_ABRPR|nr:pectinesterase inhibitor 1-like [Abrus precatorius]
MGYKFSSLVTTLFLLVASSYAISKEEVNAICKETNNPSFCVTLLSPHLNATFYELIEHTIDGERLSITNTIKLINALISQSAKNPTAQKHYKVCLEHLSKDALSDLERSQELLKKGDYQNVGVAALAIVLDVEDCRVGGSPFLDPSMLPKYLSAVDLFAQMIISISKYLHR